MGKQGPCYHCGVTSTPLWRNGPPEKPVLCNACGSRWRTKGTLANYTPLRARAELDEVEDLMVSKANTMFFENKETKVLKRKFDADASESAEVYPEYQRSCRKGFDEDAANRTSSGSVISNTETCAQYGCNDASDLTGPSEPHVWDMMVPSKKRTCIARPKSSAVEKLAKDLYAILHDQQSSFFSETSEEDLLVESNKPMISVEIGHGSVLIQHPSSILCNEDSGNVVSSICGDENEETTEKNNNGFSFDQTRLFSSNIIGDDDDEEEDSERDLLLDLPINISFMQAELLQTSSLGAQTGTKFSHP